MADKLRIMLVDDHYLVRMGLASIIALEPDMTVCAEASTGEQARALYRTARHADRDSRSQLSTREIEVLRLLVSGRRNREIATALDITEGTVKLHVSSILGKLGVSDRTEAVTVALQRGIVQLDTPQNLEPCRTSNRVVPQQNPVEPCRTGWALCL